MTDFRRDVQIRQLQSTLAAPGIAAISGAIAPNGVPDRGTGFTAEQTATGFYTVAFDTPFAETPITVAQALLTAGYAVVYDETETGFNVATVDNTGASADRAFNFRSDPVA